MLPLRELKFTIIWNCLKRFESSRFYNNKIFVYHSPYNLETFLYRLFPWYQVFHYALHYSDTGQSRRSIPMVSNYQYSHDELTDWLIPLLSHNRAIYYSNVVILNLLPLLRYWVTLLFVLRECTCNVYPFCKSQLCLFPW